jgi:flagellar motor switch/type III secretory pathway protein FliN
MAPEIDKFRNIPVVIEVRTAKRSASLEELAALKEDSVIMLDQTTGETLDLYVSDVRLASVEVLVVDNRLAARITDLDHSLTTVMKTLREASQA